MKTVLKGGNAAAMLRVALEKGESLSIAQDSVVACSDSLSFSGRSDGGILIKLARRFSRGNFKYQEITALAPDQWIMLAPEMAGGAVAIELQHFGAIIMEERAFLAASPDVVISRKIKKLEEIGIDSIQLSGKGTAHFSGAGAIEAMALLPEQSVLVATDHLVAFEAHIPCKNPENGMVKMTGPGLVWLQTRRMMGPLAGAE